MFPKDTLLLDLGSYEIKGMFFDDNLKQTINVKEKKSGIFNGYVVNVFLFQTSVLNLVKRIESQINKKIVNIVLLLSGKILEYKTLSVKNLKIQGVIDQFKIDMISRNIKKWVKNKNGVLIKSFPVKYILDDFTIENPYGLFCDNLSFQYFICYAFKSKINNLIYLLEQLNFNVIDLVPSILSLGDRYLSEDEKGLGSLVFDIGHSKMQWCFYYKGAPVKAGNINFGSESITYKIARSLNLSLEEASRIKHESLAAALKPEHFCSWIRIVRDSNEEFILQSEMIRKILPEITIFINEIKKTISLFSNQKIYNVVCFGNASFLSDLIESLQKGTTLKIKTVGKDDIFGVADLFFKNFKNEKSLNRIIKFLKRVIGYFLDA
ncbi:cell division FtsA domain-containing protein [Alphaproteobacteria bacterium endosymbiont of Tiliacea citrago]|uniref:cell division FtsA domain-containing protein n=1 Tax=Alphaproteobacteria bacterium endosymbiont of Tiliacea citrago TaxID=3077944 RepID=UPI00313E2C78